MSSTAGDPHLDPASGVLRYLLSITDAAALARAEAALSASRLIDLELDQLTTCRTPPDHQARPALRNPGRAGTCVPAAGKRGHGRRLR